MPIRYARPALALLAAFALVTCGDDSGGAPNRVASAIGVLSGDGQSGPAGSLLPAPIVARVTDVNGDARPDVIVMYESESATSLSVRNGSIHVYLNQGPAAP